MRKIKLIGIFIILFGTVLVIFSVSQSGDVVLESEYLTIRGIVILGFVMMVGGGLITLSPFGRK